MPAPYAGEMTNPSPGPGWWMASDGNWYPQRWEYKTITAWDHPTVEAASKALTDLVTRLGQEGWEMVNYTANPTWAPKTGAGSSTELKKWTILIYFKRPIAP